MRVWFDTEFMEDGKTIELLSIGMVREDDKRLYLENAEADFSHANPWVAANVLPKLAMYTRPSDIVVPRTVMRDRIMDFLGDEGVPPGKPEFWAYYADYDWVVLCQLFGTMMDLPRGWPMYCRDFKQWLDENGKPELHKLPESESHNALADALWLRDEWNRLRGAA